MQNKEICHPRLLLARLFITGIQRKLTYPVSPSQHKPQDPTSYYLFFNATVYSICTCGHAVDNFQPNEDYNHKENWLSFPWKTSTFNSSWARSGIINMLSLHAVVNWSCIVLCRQPELCWVHQSCQVQETFSSQSLTSLVVRNFLSLCSWCPLRLSESLWYSCLAHAWHTIDPHSLLRSCEIFH